MREPSENEIRMVFESHMRQMRTFFPLTRDENGDYAFSNLEAVWRGFNLGYSVGYDAAHDQSPAFTVTPDAQSRARDFESVNPDYPSPATYQEAE